MREEKTNTSIAAPTIVLALFWIFSVFVLGCAFPNNIFVMIIGFITLFPVPVIPCLVSQWVCSRLAGIED